MDKVEVIAENLRSAEAALAEGWELRYAHLKELSRLLLREGAPREQIAEGYRALMGALSRRREAGDSPLSALYPELDLHSRLMLAREWASVADPMPLPDCEPLFGEGFTIAHFGNLYADRAFAAFSEGLGSASARPVEDYTAACEEVSEGNADFCILPIESARDGAMDRFEQMIDRYSLFVLLTCSLKLTDDSEEGEDGGEWIRFALLASSPCRLTGDRYPGADRIGLEITAEGEALWALLLAAEHVGARLLDCRLCGSRAKRAALYRLTFSADEVSRSALLAYLEIGYSGYTLIGAYRELPELPLEQ